jgi:hypothetical protein
MASPEARGTTTQSTKRTQRHVRPLLLNLLVFAASAAVTAGLTAGVLHWQRSPSRDLPYHDEFSSGSNSEWVAYDGNWNVRSGIMINESNERGAKLVTGSPYWTDYALDADISLNSIGDAGVIARVSDAEPGVDSYSGIYGGLRVRDEALVLGVADHAWNEVIAKPMPEPISSNVWYHIRMAVYGCRVDLSAKRDGQQNAVQLAVTIPGCPLRGKIGLRSYDSGGQWKNIRVTKLPE